MCAYDTIFKRNVCLICFEEIKETYLYQLYHDTKICFSCMKKFKVLEKKYMIEDCPTTILYHYNDFFKNLLYQYKGLGDVALAPAFFCRHDYYKKKYEDYLVVCVPSLAKDNLERGFAPIEQLARVFSNRLFTGLYKKEDIKQSLMKSRFQAKDNFGIEDGYLLTNQKVLLLDDVYTSGTTLTSCIQLVKKYQPQEIEVVVLSLSPKSSLKEISISLFDKILYLKEYLRDTKNFVDEFFFKKFF